MLAELEPAKEVTGGPWYQADSGFDEGFVAVLREVVQKEIARGPCTLDELVQRIRNYVSAWGREGGGGGMGLEKPGGREG